MSFQSSVKNQSIINANNNKASSNDNTREMELKIQQDIQQLSENITILTNDLNKIGSKFDCTTLRDNIEKTKIICRNFARDIELEISTFKNSQQQKNNNNNNINNPKLIHLEKKFLVLKDLFTQISKNINFGGQTSSSQQSNNPLDWEIKVNPKTQQTTVIHSQPIQYTVEDLTKVNEDLKILQEIFSDFQLITMEQDEKLNTIEQNVDDSQKNVESGKNDLFKAANYKYALIPVVGAVVGTAVLGPVGLILGIKIGGVIVLGLTLGSVGAVSGGGIGFLIKKKLKENLIDLKYKTSLLK